MKKLMCTLLVTMLTMVAMTAMAIDPPIVMPHNYFTITNNSTKAQPTRVYAKDFSSNGELTVNLIGGLHEGDVLEISYSPFPSMFTPKITWLYGWGGATEDAKPTFTTTVPVGYSSFPSQDFFIVCDYYEDGQGKDFKEYTMKFNKTQKGSRITVKSSNASEVQVTYENYGEVSSAGQRASVALYDIYGNKVSDGYLDALGMSTLSTKGKPGYYIVKVIMNNLVIFTETIQVK